MNSETLNQATWWITGHFVLKPAPHAFASIPTDNDWEESLRTAGYVADCSYGGEFDPVSIHIWRNSAGRHFLVEVWNASCQLSRFFVEADERNAFFATWYVGFLRDHTVITQGEIFSRMQKTFTAFVRHGHGEDTISEDGDMSLDDRLYLDQQRRERQKSKASCC